MKKKKSWCDVIPKRRDANGKESGENKIDILHSVCPAGMRLYWCRSIEEAIIISRIDSAL